MAADPAVLAKLRKFCLSLPESVEVAAWEHPNFRVGNKTFAVFERYDGRPRIAVKQEIPEQQVLLQDPRFFLTPYVGKHGWVSYWTDGAVDWNLVFDLVLRSFELVANKRQLAQLEGATRRKPRRTRNSNASGARRPPKASAARPAARKSKATRKSSRKPASRAAKKTVRRRKQVAGKKTSSRRTKRASS